MLKGSILNNSSTIGIIAPSSYEDNTKINNLINQFKTLGFNIKLGNHLFEKNSFFAGSDYNRASDINDMFADKNIDGIICLRGGYGSIRTIPYINKELIINNPKFFCGFSDITMLLNYFNSLGLITFHGPMINSNFNDIKTLSSFINIIKTHNTNFFYNLNLYPYINYSNLKSFSGKLVGGNLSILCSSIGTPYEIDTSNSIIFLEEINEAPYTIDRMLTQLIFANKFKSCNGVIVGYLSNTSNYNNSNDKKLFEQTIIDRLKPLNIPIILGFPCGHNYPNLTIPIGCNILFDSISKNIIFLDSFLNNKKASE